MSVWLDPDTLKPIYAGTYFPAKSRGQMPTFPYLLQQIADAWLAQRDELKEYSDRVAEAVKNELSAPTATIAVNQADVDAALNALLSIYDEQDGGFAGSPERSPHREEPAAAPRLSTEKPARAWGRPGRQGQSSRSAGRSS